jgi:transcriptional regulator with PAS, ATPase and Fis domain
MEEIMNKTSTSLASKTRSSLKLADLLLSRINDPVFVIDKDYMIASLNRAGECLLSRSPAGKRCYETLAESTRPCDGCSLPLILSGHAAPSEQMTLRDGKCYEVTRSCLVCDDGAPVCLSIAREAAGARRPWESPPDARAPARRERFSLPAPLTTLSNLDNLLGESKPWLEVKALIRKLAPYPTVTVLLLGETGTGKELVAQALHTATFGSDAPFIPLNCTAIPEHLVESELFGYEPGAFTGAQRTKKGLFELAHGGTLFLDEVEGLTLATQVKLLRVLETRSFIRLGGLRQQAVEFRLCCAVNKPLRAMVAQGEFREDLYQRMNSFLITLPPLRERQQDLPLLTHAFIAEANIRLGKRVKGIAPDVLAMLHEYSWSGNVRELRNLMERAVILTEDYGRIEKNAFPPELFSSRTEVMPTVLLLNEIEKRHIQTVLTSCRGNQSLAARCLGISRTTLYKKLRDYNLSCPETEPFLHGVSSF